MKPIRRKYNELKGIIDYPCLFKSFSCLNTPIKTSTNNNFSMMAAIPEEKLKTEFKLRTEFRGNIKKLELESEIKQRFEIDKIRREFKALPLKRSLNFDIFSKKRSRSLDNKILVKNFKLKTEIRAKTREEFEKEMEERRNQLEEIKIKELEEKEREIEIKRLDLEKQIKFKATPIRHYKKIIIEKSKSKLTSPKEFKFKGSKTKCHN